MELDTRRGEGTERKTEIAVKWRPPGEEKKREKRVGLSPADAQTLFID